MAVSSFGGGGLQLTPSKAVNSSYIGRSKM